MGSLSVLSKSAFDTKLQGEAGTGLTLPEAIIIPQMTPRPKILARNRQQNTLTWLHVAQELAVQLGGQVEDRSRLPSFGLFESQSCDCFCYGLVDAIASNDALFTERR